MEEVVDGRGFMTALARLWPAARIREAVQRLTGRPSPGVIRTDFLVARALAAQWADDPTVF